jgi:hypothetical protein
MYLKSAINGLNGDNETNIGSSSMIDYSLYNQNKVEYNIKNVLKPIEFKILKQIDNTVNNYQTLNATNFNLTISQTRFVNYSFNIASNTSIHFQLRPKDITLKIGYLVILKYGNIPSVLNGFYDLWKLFCPNGKIHYQS